MLFIWVCSLLGCREEGGGSVWATPLQGGKPCPFQGSSSCIGVHLTLNSHLWLQEAVACDSGHTPVNRFGWQFKPGGEGSRLGLKPSGESDRGCLPKHAKTGPGGVSGRERFSSYGHEGAATASGVERKGHGKALQTSWPSIAAKEVPSHDRFLYHWILASAAKRVGLSLCTGPPTKALQRWARGEVAGGGNHRELQRQTRTQAAWMCISFFLWCSTGRLRSPFRGSTAQPHMRGGTIKGAIKKAHLENQNLLACWQFYL